MTTLASIDDPFVKAAEALLRILYRQCDVSPMRALYGCDVAFGVSLSAAGLVGLDHPMIIVSMFAAAMAVAGVVFSWTSMRRLRSCPSEWTVGSYKNRLMIADHVREARRLSRLAHLFAAITHGTVGIINIQDGDSPTGRFFIMIGVCFLGIFMAEALRAAEPPHPDEGDGFQMAPQGA